MKIIKMITMTCRSLIGNRALPRWILINEVRFLTALLFFIFTQGYSRQWGGTNPIFWNNGSVGIGTSSPDGLLHLKAPSNNYYWSSHNFGASLVIDGGHHNAIALLDASSSNPIAISNNSGVLMFSRMPPLGNSTSNPDYLMAIKPDGRVGIRAVSPQSYLDVRNPDSGEGQTVTVANFTFGGQNHFNTGEGKIMLGSEAFSNGIMKRAAIGFTAAGWNGGGALKFYTASNNSTYEPEVRMIINEVGGVGIGTSNPGSYRLAVEGKIGAREVNVTTASWSDYVFHDDYDLKPLEKVQQYIRENRHLPDVPSEAEVKENGQDLGAMNSILLRKIEELMLYVIELKEENKLERLRNEKMNQDFTELTKEIERLKLSMKSKK